jgi:hypothetical protein
MTIDYLHKNSSIMSIFFCCYIIELYNMVNTDSIDDDNLDDITDNDVEDELPLPSQMMPKKQVQQQT